MKVSDWDGGTILAAAGLVLTLGLWLVDRYVVRRRRLSYRVHWDRSVTFGSAHAQSMGLKINHRGAVVDQPSIVLLRVRNVGSSDIAPQDFSEQLEFSFGGRRIVHYEVQDSDVPELHQKQVQASGAPRPDVVDLRTKDQRMFPEGTLKLPRITMARSSRFKLLLLLAGEPDPMLAKVSADTSISGRNIDMEKRPGTRSPRSLAFGAVALVLVGLLVGFVVTRGSTPAPVAQTLQCPPVGQLSVNGSTSLYQGINLISKQYMRLCPAARIQVTPMGTDAALSLLNQDGLLDRKNHAQANIRIELAMADQYLGETSKYPDLTYTPIGVGAFAFVVNKSTGIDSLTAQQLGRLFDGDLSRWDNPELDGASQDVVLVSRENGSGTRNTFEQRVLGGHAETAPITSRNCQGKNIDGAPPGVMHCFVTSTAQVLAKVAATPGAIGYANYGQAEAMARKNGDLVIIELANVYPGKATVADNSYPFWAVEKLYRFGPDQPTTVRDSFVHYIQLQKLAHEILTREGFYACDDPTFQNGQVADACSQGSDGPASASASAPRG
jgi:phosphate transport system substrate-binding protein